LKLTRRQFGYLVDGDAIPVTNGAILCRPQKPPVSAKQLPCRPTASHRSGHWVVRVQHPWTLQPGCRKQQSFHERLFRGREKIPVVVQEDGRRINECYSLNGRRNQF